MRLAPKIVLPTIAIVATIVLGVAMVATRALESALFEEEYLTVVESVRAHAGTVLSESDLADPWSDAAAARFAAFIQENQHASRVRITVWGTDHRVLASDLSGILGEAISDPSDLDRALAFGRPFYLVRESDDRRPRQTSVRNFLAIYVPITVGRAHAVVEVHSVMNAVLQPIREATKVVTYALMIGGLLMFVLLTWVLHRVVLRPVRALAAAADRIAEGDYATPVEIATGDEMERFGKTFEAMRAKVSVFVATLENAVRTRTAELEEARAELAASISSLPLGFGLFALDGKLLQSNENLGRLLEVPVLTTVRDIAGRFGPGFSLDDYLCQYQEEGCDSVGMREITLEARFLRCFIVPVARPSDPSAFLGVAILVEDITESKLLERAKDEFFAVASHELRTPLTAIRGNAALLKDMRPAERGEKEALAMLSDIEAASIRLIKIVNDFLDVSRIEQGGVSFKKEEFDLVPLLRATMEELSALAKERGLELAEDGVWPETLPVIADQDRTKQVAVNLIGNALKFTRRGFVHVGLGWAEDSAVVRVKDTGPGIATKEQQLLFRKFQQAQQEMLARDLSQSTGLGLYIAKLSVEKMGGTIELERSEVGKGSTFRFTIPLVK